MNSKRRLFCLFALAFGASLKASESVEKPFSVDNYKNCIKGCNVMTSAFQEMIQAENKNSLDVMYHVGKLALKCHAQCGKKYNTEFETMARLKSILEKKENVQEKNQEQSSSAPIK